MAFPHDFQSFFLVAFGAALGANTRYIIYQRLEKVSKSKHLRIFIINNFSSILLGLLYALSMKNYLYYSHQLSLIFIVGFLGSMSTFSTFIYDLFEIYFQFKIFKIVKIFITSVSFSLLTLIIGYLIGNI